MCGSKLNCLTVGSYAAFNLYPVTVLAVRVSDITELFASGILCLYSNESVGVLNLGLGLNKTASALTLEGLGAVLRLYENPCTPVVLALGAICLSSECKYSESCNAKNNCHENCCKLSHFISPFLILKVFRIYYTTQMLLSQCFF